MSSTIDLSSSVIMSYWNYVIQHYGGYNTRELAKFLGELKKGDTKYQYISEGDTADNFVTKVAMANAKMNDINSKSTDTGIDLEKTSNSLSEIDISRRAGNFTEAIQFSKGNTSGFSGDMSKDDLIDLLRANNSSNPDRTTILDKIKKGKDIDLNEADILSDMISESNGIVNQSSIDKLLKSVRVSTGNGRRKMTDMLDEYTDIKDKVTNIKFDSKQLVKNNLQNSIRERRDEMNKVLNPGNTFGNKIDNVVRYYVEALIYEFDKEKGRITNYSDLRKSGLLEDAIRGAKEKVERNLRDESNLNVPSINYCMPIWELIPDSFTPTDFDILNNKRDRDRKKKLIDSIVHGLVGKSKDATNPDSLGMDSVNTVHEVEGLVAALSKLGKMELKGGAKEIYEKSLNALKDNKIFKEMEFGGRVKVNDDNTIEIVGDHEDNTRLLNTMQKSLDIILSELSKGTLRYANDAAGTLINEVRVMHVNNETYAVNSDDINNIY